MIRIRTRVHDKFSLEFKLWLQTSAQANGKGLKDNKFLVESWMFIPSSLDINALSYSRETFYSDIKTYYRTFTPVYKLGDLALAGEYSPLEFLQTAVFNVANLPDKINIQEYDYHIKMFCAIFKSALREEYNTLKLSYEKKKKQVKQEELKLTVDSTLELIKDVCDEEINAEIDSFIAKTYSVINNYDKLSGRIKGKVDDKLYALFNYGNEFIINLSEFYFFKLYHNFKGSEKKIKTLKEIEAFKLKRGYGVLKKQDDVANSRLLYKWSVLKKLVESDLFLGVDKRKNGVVTEQVYYSLAAGLSMIFATIVSFSFQQKYGNFTVPFFIALVISYMLKDRIKDLMRYAFANNRRINYFDHKTTLTVKETLIGVSREGVDFVPLQKVPKEIRDLRDTGAIVELDTSLRQENIIFYRTQTNLMVEPLDNISEYDILGVNQIIVLNLISLIKKMDDPAFPFSALEGNQIFDIKVDKVYYINLVLRLSSFGESYLKHYRVALSRAGVSDFYEWK